MGFIVKEFEVIWTSKLIDTFTYFMEVWTWINTGWYWFISFGHWFEFSSWATRNTFFFENKVWKFTFFFFWFNWIDSSFSFVISFWEDNNTSNGTNNNGTTYNRTDNDFLFLIGLLLSITFNKQVFVLHFQVILNYIILEDNNLGSNIDETYKIKNRQIDSESADYIKYQQIYTKKLIKNQ